MKIVREGISYETIHKFGLTELLNIYRQDKKRFPKDWWPHHGSIDDNWIWSGAYYIDKESDNWIFKVTGHLRYLLYYEGVLYDIEISSSKQGNAYHGGNYSGYFELEGIKALKLIEQWEKIPVKQINRNWESFTLKGDDFWAGEIPYDDTPIDKKQLEDVKQYFKEALYSIEITRLNEIEEDMKRDSLDFSLNINIEMNW